MVFFGAGIAIVIAFMISFHYLAEKPYRKSFNRNIVTYTRLIADKIRFDPRAMAKIEASAGIKIITKRKRILRMIHKKDLHFRPISSYISVTRPGRTFFVKYEDGYEMFLLRVKDQSYHPENIDAIIVAIIIALIILFLTYNRVQKIFRPVDRIQKMTKEYGKGNFDQRIPVEGSGQLAQLTISINELAQKIKSMLDAKRDLFLAIGHELKTPLARLRLQVEMLDGGQSEMVDNINEMTSIIDQLIEAERVANHSELNREVINIRDFVQKFSDERVEVLADKVLHARIDPIRMELAIKNLINNSKKYAPNDTKIQLELKSDLKQIWITDKGPGVNPKIIKNLTEAFFRPEEARCRETGGVGLGLYLVKNIIEAHKGKLIIENMHPGLRVIIKLTHSEQDETLS